MKLPGGQGLAGWVWLAVLLLVGGCATSSAPVQRPAAYRAEKWDATYPHTQCLVTQHYRIYTDIRDRELTGQLPALMETAYQHYRIVAPSRRNTGEAMKCFIFGRRAEWASFTSKNTGEDAAVYLKINRGAYTVDDWFVAFWLGDVGTFAVAGHEGFHQYAARHFIGRLPPALEEGLACMFENISWNGGVPVFDVRHSPQRSRVLAATMADGRLLPLKELLRMHAGDAIKQPREQIESFYAQNWALAMYLLDHHRPGMERYLSELSVGAAYYPANMANLKPRSWNPELSEPQLEYYIGRRVEQIEAEYRAYCARLARGVE